jgi:ribosome-interacting GTPase 1
LPANLTAEAKTKWREAELATNPREKLLAYQDFLSAIPKHKGNERLRAQIKTKIANLKEELLARRGKRSGGQSIWRVEREGAAQVILFGPTKAGRSSLLKSLTNAQVVVADYEFATQRATPGMLPFEDVQLQLVELPAPQVNREGEFEIQPEAIDLIRAADGMVLVLDLTADPFDQLRRLISALGKVRISTQRTVSRVEIVPEKGSGEIRIATSSVQTSCTPVQVRELLHSYGMKNALVRIYGDVTVDDVEDAIFENVTTYKPSMIIVNKLDLPGAKQAADYFMQQNPASLPTLFTSCLTGQGLKEVGTVAFRALGIIRVYTKEPNATRPSENPFVVHAGTTVQELARSIHTDLANRYRYSRIWGPTSKFAGERVGPDHVLADRDIVEIHTG